MSIRGSMKSLKLYGKFCLLVILGERVSTALNRELNFDHCTPSPESLSRTQQDIPPHSTSFLFSFT